MSPVGVALVAMLEGEVRSDIEERRIPADCDPGAVTAAAEAVSRQSWGSFLSLAVDIAATGVGPWNSSCADDLAAAYRHAEQRASIADAINDNFGAVLHAAAQVGDQQWWHDGRNDERPRFRAFDRVYGAGQVTEAGFWTVSDPPSEAHAALISAWELELGPISRWHMPVRPTARVYEIHRPQDWALLVEAHPLEGRTFFGWELPGPNQRAADLQELLRTPGQRAARTSIRQQLVPDWASVATKYDGVHLSWAGFLTSEGCVTDLGDSVTMLRYWLSERTLWLADIFEDPMPAPPPIVETTGTAITVCDVRTDDDRRRLDQAILAAQVARHFRSFDVGS